MFMSFFSVILDENVQWNALIVIIRCAWHFFYDLRWKLAIECNEMIIIRCLWVFFMVFRGKFTTKCNEMIIIRCLWGFFSWFSGENLQWNAVIIIIRCAWLFFYDFQVKMCSEMQWLDFGLIFTSFFYGF